MFTVAITAALALSGIARADILAQEVLGSFGERSELLSCPYECNPVSKGMGWRSVTTLMLVNPTLTDLDSTRIYFFDGNSSAVARADIVLLALDLDAVNVCRTLQEAGLAVPSAGFVTILIPDPVLSQIGSGAAYGWVRNLYGKFNITENEPFDGRVVGGSEAECRVVGPGAQNSDGLGDHIGDFFPGLPLIDPILIEQTGD